MQNATAKLLFLLVVTGALFTACSKQPEAEELTEDEGGSLQEAVMGGLEEESEEVEEETGDADTQSSGTKSGDTGSKEPAAEESAEYKDGTYSVDGAYQSPAGAESVGVTLVVKEGKVSSVSIGTKATNEASIRFQDLFAQGVSAQVVGKPLSSLGSLGAVNGSSLTPIGFNNAVASIQALAKN